MTMARCCTSVQVPTRHSETESRFRDPSRRILAPARQAFSQTRADRSLARPFSGAPTPPKIVTLRKLAVLRWRSANSAHTALAPKCTPGWCSHPVRWSPKGIRHTPFSRSAREQTARSDGESACSHCTYARSALCSVFECFVVPHCQSVRAPRVHSARLRKCTPGWCSHPSRWSPLEIRHTPFSARFRANCTFRR